MDSLQGYSSSGSSSSEEEESSGEEPVPAPAAAPVAQAVSKKRALPSADELLAGGSQALPSYLKTYSQGFEIAPAVKRSKAQGTALQRCAALNDRHTSSVYLLFIAGCHR